MTAPGNQRKLRADAPFRSSWPDAMPEIPIDDLDDPRLAPYRHLKATNATRDLGLFVLEGEKLVDQLLVSRYPAVSVLATDRHAARIAPGLPADLPLYVVAHAAISGLVGYDFHRGVLACGRRLAPPGLDEVLGGAGPKLTLVVCPELHNPENLGAIVRIADVFGVAAVLVGGACPDPLSRRVLRVSMGTALRVPVLARPDLVATAEGLRAIHGVRLVAAVLDPRAARFDADPIPDRLALFLGSEGDGLPPAWEARCDLRITIPMRPGAESLNVAVAAGILLHHFARR